jgi:hypothetical protein
MWILHSRHKSFVVVVFLILRFWLHMRFCCALPTHMRTAQAGGASLHFGTGCDLPIAPREVGQRHAGPVVRAAPKQLRPIACPPLLRAVRQPPSHGSTPFNAPRPKCTALGMDGLQPHTASQSLHLFTPLTPPGSSWNLHADRMVFFCVRVSVILPGCVTDTTLMLSGRRVTK